MSETEKLEPLVEEYLELKKTEGTRRVYRAGFRKFLDWYDGSLEDFLNRIYDELKKPIREQQRIAETTINRWIQWLVSQGYASKSIHAYFSAVQNFLKYHRITLSAEWIGNLPAAIPQRKNKKHEWRLEHIKEFLGLANNYRDKALIMCMFQSGLGINEIVELNYGDVRRELEDNVLPLCLDLVRGKTKQRFKTFFGRDAVKYLRLYLETRNNLRDDSPLFTMLGREERITKAAIEKRFRELAGQSPFIRERDINNGYNPLRPHSLRSAFRSALTGKMDGDLIEFFMGHSIGEQKRTYINLPTDELRELYSNYERYLSIEKTSKDELSQATKAAQITEEYKAKISYLERAVADLTIKTEALRELEPLMRALLFSYCKSFNPPEKWDSLKRFIAERDLRDLVKIVQSIDQRRS